MQMTSLGRGGPLVSRLGLGLAALGRPGYMTVGHDRDFADGRSVEAMRAQALRVLDEAYALGVRYFDAARSYGLAEAFLEAWGPRADAVVGSKWGYTYTAEWKTDAAVHEVKDHSLAAFKRQWAETRGVLGTRVSLYQIHSATLETGVLENAAVLGALARLRAEGVRVGLSVTGPRQAEVVRKALAVRVDGVALFQSVQATWNLLERSVGEALAEAHDAGVGVIVKEALANGRLTERGGGVVKEALANGKLTERGGVVDDVTALAAVLAQPWVDVVLSGAATVEQLRSNVRAAAASVQVGDVLERMKPMTPVDYWQERAQLAWT